MDSRIFGRDETKQLGDSVDFVKRKLLKWCNRVVEFYDVNKDIEGLYNIDDYNSSYIRIPKGSKIMNFITFKNRHENKIMSPINKLLFNIYCFINGYKSVFKYIETIKK